MMLICKNTCPVDYRMCRQTVTVYHKEGNAFTRTVHKKAFLDFRKNQTVDKTGSKEVNAFLLVIPCDVQTVFVGDKVVLGEGPEVSSQSQWTAMTPTTMPGLCVVKYADPKYWGTQMVHVEAGG